MRRDLDDVIQGWPYDPEPGEHLRARSAPATAEWFCRSGSSSACSSSKSADAPMVCARMGLSPTSITCGTVPPAGDWRRTARRQPWMMTAHQCAEADREFIQFYHRRIAWLALRRHDKAIQDADHTLALMDFVRRHGA